MEMWFSLRSKMCDHKDDAVTSSCAAIAIACRGIFAQAHEELGRHGRGRGGRYGIRDAQDVAGCAPVDAAAEAPHV
jgi:hypothetical protein